MSQNISSSAHWCYLIFSKTKLKEQDNIHSLILTMTKKAWNSDVSPQDQLCLKVIIILKHRFSKLLCVFQHRCEMPVFECFDLRHRPEEGSRGQLNGHPRHPTERDRPVLLQRDTHKTDSTFHRQKKKEC